MNDYTYKTIENDDYKLTIDYDTDQTEGPFDWNDELIFLSNHRDYKSCNAELEIDQLSDGELKEFYKGKEIVKISAYIHGGIALSLGEFECRFDSGMFGYLIFDKGEFGKDNIGLKGFIKSWDQYLNGNVYGFILEKKIKCDHCGQNDNEIISSLGGMYDFTDITDYMEIDECDFTELVKKELENE